MSNESDDDVGRSGQSVRRRVKARLIEEQDHRCAYCNRLMQTDDRLAWDYATFDHIVSLSEGGPNTARNGVAACQHCNKHKRSHTVASLRRMADVIERLMFERGLEYPPLSPPIPREMV